MLVTMNEILRPARAGGYGIAAPNVWNEDTARAAIHAAEAHRAPIILDAGFAANPDILRFGAFMTSMAREASVPVAINLDHGKEFAHAIWAVRAGYSSVMVDRSTLPFEENVAQVTDVARIAHAVGMSVESELGHVGQGSQYDVDRAAALTDPAQAQEFVARTGVDCLAVAIGTAHGVYVGEPKLEFDLLHRLFDAVQVPLVLHGGSGTGDENLARATREGISKVNIGTDLLLAGLAAAHACQNGKALFSEVAAGWQAKLIHYMQLFGQCNRA